MSPTAVFLDRLGDRVTARDRSNNALDGLRLRPELTSEPEFEARLRARAGRLAGFSHPAFVKVRGVLRQPEPVARLVVVSERAPGRRLSETLEALEHLQMGIAIGSVLHLLRGVTAALAALHAVEPDLAHGAIGPERIVIDHAGNPLIAEYILGPALDLLPQQPPERLWREYRLAVPADGSPRFGQAADVLQVGLVALALVKGRPLRRDEYPGSLAETLEGLGGTPSAGWQPLGAPLNSWLRGALRIGNAASEPWTMARTVQELERLMAEADATGAPASNLDAVLAAVERFLTTGSNPGAPAIRAPEDRPAPAVTAPIAAATPASVAEAPPAPAAEAAPAPVAEAAPALAAEPTVAAVAEATPVPLAEAAPTPAPVVEAQIATSEAGPTPSPAVARPRQAAAEQPGDAPARRETLDICNPDVVPIATEPRAAASPEHHRVVASRPMFGVEDSPPAAPGEPSRGSAKRGGRIVAAAIAAAVILAAAGYLAYRPGEPARTPPAENTSAAGTPRAIDHPEPVSTGGLRVISEPPGLTVVVDGTARGKAPVTIEGLSAGPHAVSIEGDNGRAAAQQVNIAAGTPAEVTLVLPAPEPAPASASIAAVLSNGSLLVSAPIDLQIIESGRIIGTSQSGPVGLAAGRHSITLANDALGYKTTHLVEVRAGATARLEPELPKGRASFNADPWAEVWVDGERLGETPLGNVALQIGTHQVVFRHPELGEHRQSITVTVTGQARLSAGLR